MTQHRPVPPQSSRKEGTSSEAQVPSARSPHPLRASEGAPRVGSRLQTGKAQRLVPARPRGTAASGRLCRLASPFRRKAARAGPVMLVFSALALRPCLPEEGSASSLLAAASANCGLFSLRALARIIGRPISSRQWLEITRRWSNDALSMANVRDAGALLGIALTGWRMTTGELAGLRSPAVVHFTSGHFVTVVDCVGETVRWLDHGGDMVVSTMAEFGTRFSGNVLLPERHSADRTPRAAPISFDALDFDAGIVVLDSAVVHRFRCMNRGPHPISARFLGSSPGCRVEPEGTVRIDPRQTLDVEVHGVVHRRNTVHWVTVLDSDGTAPVCFLTLRAQSPKPVEVSPSRVTIVPRRHPLTPTRLWLLGPASLRVDSIAITPPCVVARVEEAQAVDDETTAIPISLEVPERANTGPHEGALVLHTNDSRRPVLTVPVVLQPESGLVVAPPSAFFGFVKPATVRQREITVAALDRSQFRVIAVQSEVPDVRLGAPKARGHGGFTFTVELPSALQTDVLIDGCIVVTTNLPGDETLRIRVTAFVVE